MNKKKKEIKTEKVMTIFLVLVLAFAIFVIFFTMKSFYFTSEKISQTQQPAMQAPSMTRMSLTSYDRGLARQMMDKNNDGKCDVCGMPIEMCIDSGMMQCNMDSKSTIGLLDSQHIHADWKIYINGEPLDFSDKAHMARMQANLPVSSFLHVDSGAPAPEQTGNILHMHATGVPLWIFFDSIVLELPNGMKAYVNGKEISDYRNYVFNDLDEILITDGTGDLKEQLNSITNFAEIH